ncbi:helix-turn-helix domain-containing protein [Solitalea sp. MAHUQ-68]|uniref:Helix-turn-helix domain-containing protein n=1 Tax=Solitalea agri TaxID=2953739 RepID=A0A9X2F057_9SPHI|nr:helix-turn-helix domain-containing protein [Solitalea agri]MCO4292274.1 helix-turn-helix domain-containing protein [Solitalea agri]
MFDSSNSAFKYAVQFVNQTNRHLFITGKAGTGKTTFLKYIYQNSPKKMVIVAPTGVAAINAGGVTIHSFFQLPFEAFLPINQPQWNKNQGQFNTIYSFLKNLKISKERRELMQEIELLVIDEVSMVRADLLDTIDHVLRFVRKRPEPFGGVQVVYIGDLFQLPPVVKNDEWEVLKNYYESPFFFDAHVIKQSELLYLELTKIYRQKDTVFIDILNNIRNNVVLPQDLEVLHRHYHPDFQPPKEENYITLTTHTAKADNINLRELNSLPSKSYRFNAEVTGDFNDKAYPADAILELKENAQIMFIKNDKGESRRYYNGKIATVKSIREDSITVVFNNGNEIELEKESWKNVKFQFNSDNDNIDEVVLGEFKQYPIRLAWAVTIHKSQGLTFEKAIVDAGASFAAGQVYVALSRLTNMNGLVLLSKITPAAVLNNTRVIEFCKREFDPDILVNQLERDRTSYINSLLLQTFNWNKLVFYLEQHYDNLAGGLIADRSEAATLAEKWYKTTKDQLKVAETFSKQLGQLLSEAQSDNYGKLNERIDKASAYFLTSINEMLDSLDDHINQTRKKKRVVKYLAALKQLRKLIFRKVELIKAAQLIAHGLSKGIDSTILLEEMNVKSENPGNNDEVDSPTEKNKKGETRFISLQLFKEGKSIADIATERNMTSGTIEGHLASFIATGEIKVEELISEEKLKPILDAIQASGSVSLGVLKENLGANFSYTEIKVAVAYWQATQALNK